MQRHTLRDDQDPAHSASPPAGALPIRCAPFFPERMTPSTSGYLGAVGLERSCLWYHPLGLQLVGPGKRLGHTVLLASSTVLTLRRHAINVCKDGLPQLWSER